MDKPDPEDLLAFADQLFRSAGWLAGIARPQHSRARMAARLFAGAPLVVELTAAALKEHPQLFPERPRLGPALALGQHRASAYLVLRNRLLHLAQLAHNGYLEEQSQALAHTVALLEEVRAEDAPTAFDRQAALALALCALALFQRPRGGRPRKKPAKRGRAPRATDEPTLDDLMRAMFAAVRGGRKSTSD
jgi:hypothetical protein